MKKLLGFSFLLAVVLLCHGKAEAANPTRGAKFATAIAYSATASSPTAKPGPIVVYSVIMSTGATGDFVALYDTNTVTGVTATENGLRFKTRCMAGSTIATTMCNYDPPLQFNNGLAYVLSTAADAALIIWEPGRVTNGY